MVLFKDFRLLERMRGIEPPSNAWKALVLPLNYIRKFVRVKVTLTAHCGFLTSFLEAFVVATHLLHISALVGVEVLETPAFGSQNRHSTN